MRNVLHFTAEGEATPEEVDEAALADARAGVLVEEGDGDDGVDEGAWGGAHEGGVVGTLSDGIEVELLRHNTHRLKGVDGKGERRGAEVGWATKRGYDLGERGGWHRNGALVAMLALREKHRGHPASRAETGGSPPSGLAT